MRFVLYKHTKSRMTVLNEEVRYKKGRVSDVMNTDYYKTWKIQ